MTASASRGPVCHPEGIRGYGNPGLDAGTGVFLVGISPGATEVKLGKPMIGPSGKLMNNILTACGWSRDKCYATNIVCTECESPSFEQIMACRPRLLAEVQQFKPGLLVLLGNTVTEVFFPSRKPGQVRGAIDFYKPWGVHVLPTYHPAAILHNAPELITRSIVRDFMKIPEFFYNPPNPDVEFTIVADVAQGQEVLNSLRGYKGFVALDVETHMDKDIDENVPVEQRVVCFSISTGTQTWWFHGALLTQLVWHMDIQWTYHHGMFDTVALAEAMGVMLPIKHDTMYMSYALDERGGQHKLKYLARESEAAGFYEEHPSAKKWSEKLSDTPWLQTYNAKDAAYTARLATRLHARMQADGVSSVYTDFLIPGANIYRLMQQHGVFVDIDRYKALLKEYLPIREEREASLRDTIGNLGGDPNINLASPKQLGNFLYGVLRLPGGPSTDASILATLVDEHPFIAQLQDLRHLDKAINTYIVGAWDDIRRDRRIHPHPNLHAQVTGRASYTPYAVNTLPSETHDNPYLSKIRSMFTAPNDDTELLVFDFKQAEIWNAFIYCQDSNMWDDLHSGDFHRANASFIFGVPQAQVTSEQRRMAKRTTFGMFFGIGAEKLGKQINKSFAEAQAFKDAWKYRYPGYAKYMNDVFEEARTTGELVTITKRKRRFPIVIDTSIVNQAINYKIQSTSHDYLLAAIIDMYWPLRELNAHVIIDNHDAVVMESPKHKRREVVQVTIEHMQKLRFGVPFYIPAEVKCGYSLGEVEEIKI